MKLKTATKLAVERHDLRMLEAVMAQLTLKLGMNYNNCAAWFYRHAGIDRDQFEQLMYELDQRDAA